MKRKKTRKHLCIKRSWKNIILRKNTPKSFMCILWCLLSSREQRKWRGGVEETDPALRKIEGNATTYRVHLLLSSPFRHRPTTSQMEWGTIDIYFLTCFTSLVHVASVCLSKFNMDVNTGQSIKFSFTTQMIISIIKNVHYLLSFWKVNN